ncbi:cytochrome ubiquinol oxidase subunit I [Saccharicrinis sp. FJH62]|uniref:cytochrome ubiquinol oxidase subunit I n=1 Tax=Saccharicrinis sp. FJH62 TaxID=3344657 RepID=UPI0035D42FA3
MLENFDLSLVNWSRAQFALTAIYHWLFVPLTLGITFIIAIMESIYVKTGNEQWKKITKFWMTLFGINFAIGVATGLIMEFQFGTNWSNYSWFVGDIFGAPLAIEGIMAFFMESTFIAVMFFGWNKVSKRFHLLSTWLTAIGANLSALWILVANGWMQNPTGMWFNPETVRNEMVNFWEVLFSPMAISKFIHTTSSGFVLASFFVIGISSWFLLKKRHIEMAKKSILVATVFGLLSSIYLASTGDYSAKSVSENQPMKLAAAEGLYEGSEEAPLVAFGILTNTGTENLDAEGKFLVKMDVPIPGFLSLLAFGDFQSFVPGIKDLVKGNPEQGILSFEEKISRGHVAKEALKEFSSIKDKTDPRYQELYAQFKNEQWLNNYFKYFGYGDYYHPDKSVREKNAYKLIPNVSLTFYSFHVMVILGFMFIIVLGIFGYMLYRGTLEKNKWLLWLGIVFVPLTYLASIAGWNVAEIGRQPWVIQDLMPTLTAVTKIDSASVITTFWMFAAIFTALLIAELRIMFTQIKKGPQEH